MPKESPSACKSRFSRFWALLPPPQEVHVASVPVAKGRRIPAPGHRLVPRAEVSADRDEYGTKGEEQHP